MFWDLNWNPFLVEVSQVDFWPVNFSPEMLLFLSVVTTLLLFLSFDVSLFFVEEL